MWCDLLVWANGPLTCLICTSQSNNHVLIISPLSLPLHLSLALPLSVSLGITINELWPLADSAEPAAELQPPAQLHALSLSFI